MNSEHDATEPFAPASGSGAIAGDFHFYHKGKLGPLIRVRWRDEKHKQESFAALVRDPKVEGFEFHQDKHQNAEVCGGEKRGPI